MNRILILGGTGAMGVHLVNILSKTDNEVIVTSRREQKSKWQNIYFVQGNAYDSNFLYRLLNGEHYSAIVDFMSYSTQEFKSRVDMLLGCTTQYIFLSSGRVYAESLHPLTEYSDRLQDICRDERYLSTDEYALAKARQENALMNSGKTNWTIVRPYITYSSERLQLGVYEKEGWLFRSLTGRPIVFSRDIADKETTMTFGYDVSLAISKLIGNPRAFGNSFNITGNDHCTWQKVLDIYLKVLDEHGYTIKVVMAETLKEIGLTSYQFVYDRNYDRIFSNDKLLKTIGSNFEFLSMEQGLTECLSEFLENNEKNTGFRRISFKTEGIFDRYAKCFCPISKIPSNKDKAKYLLARYCTLAGSIQSKYLGVKKIDKIKNIAGDNSRY